MPSMVRFSNAYVVCLESGYLRSTCEPSITVVPTTWAHRFLTCVDGDINHSLVRIILRRCDDD